MNFPSVYKGGWTTRPFLGAGLLYDGITHMEWLISPFPRFQQIRTVAKILTKILVVILTREINLICTFLLANNVDKVDTVGHLLRVPCGVMQSNAC